MAPLSHPNLVYLHGAVWDEGPDKLCLVLEYVDGGTLLDVLVPGHNSVAWSLEGFALAHGVAQCMRYLHFDLNEPLLHRDLKPDNILVTADYTTKVADFGESRHFDMRLAKAEGDRTDLTMTFVGTRLYCAPEASVNSRQA